MVRFIRSEVRDIVISALILAVAVSNFDYVRLAIISLPLALGFILHELSHKFVAVRYGYWAAYRMWIPGLALALILGLASGGRFLLAAPGAVMIMSSYFTPRESGLIGLAGPAVNLGLAGCFYAMSYLSGIIGAIGYSGVFINLWLAFFNMLPIPPLDGSKVLSWSGAIWAGFTLPLLVLIVVFF